MCPVLTAEVPARWEHFSHDADVGVRGWGEPRDLERIEDHGKMAGAHPEFVSDRAKGRQRREMGTLGSGKHHLEIQAVAELFGPAVSQVFGLRTDEVVATIHCGSRGLGHQIGTEFLKEMVVSAEASSTRGVAEEAPGAYKNVGAVVAAAEHAGLARRVARLRPLICIKG
jgi:RNA-splicing ligase RtcB